MHIPSPQKFANFAEWLPRRRFEEHLRLAGRKPTQQLCGRFLGSETPLLDIWISEVLISI